MKIDYNKPVTRDQIDEQLYEGKFKKADKWLASKDRDISEYGKLLMDPTTFAYFHFRINGEPVKLYPYQDAIINDAHRFKIFRAANQIGKSTLIDVKAAYNLLQDHGKTHKEAIVSINLKQSGDQMRQVKSLLSTMPNIEWKDIKGESDSMSAISVDVKDKNGDVKYSNYLYCLPCSEGLLGFALNEVNLDEIEFWDRDVEYFINQIAEPRTYATKGNLSLFSNPNGQDSYVSTLEKLTLPNGSKKYHTYIFNFLDRPGNTEEDLELAKAGKGRAEVESTLLAIRTLSDRNYFTREEIENSFDKKLREVDMLGKQTFWFLDVGSKKDQSVLCGGYVEPDEHNDKLKHIYVPIIHIFPVGYPLSRVVGSVDDNQTKDGWNYVKSVKDYLAEYSLNGINPIFGVDITGNSGISPLFDSIGINPVDITFSGPAKSGMYQRLKYFMEKGLLHRCKNEEFVNQFSNLVMKKSLRGYLMIHHENESDHDDVPDSVVGLVHLADNPNVVTPTITRI